MPVALVVGLLLFAAAHSLVDHSCQADGACVAACARAMDAPGICNSSSCDPTYKYCTCPGAAVLQKDGGCKLPVVAESDGLAKCASPSYDVLLTASARATPEIKPADFSQGNLQNSTSFATLVALCLGAALERSPKHVVISNARVELLARSKQALIGNSTQASTLLFDIEVSFCTTGTSVSVDSREFERRFGAEAQRYAAMYPSTLRLLSLVQRQAQTSRVPVQTSTTTEAQYADAGQVEAASFKFTLLCIGSVLLCAALLLLCVSICVFLRSRSRSRDEVKRIKSSQHNSTIPDGDAHCWQTSQINFACVTQEFDATEAAQTDPRFQNCLNLSVGDVIEVHATRGMWLYCRQYGVSGSAGFFPEGHVAWIGRALPALPGEADADPGTLSEQFESITPKERPHTATRARVDADVELGAPPADVDLW